MHAGTESRPYRDIHEHLAKLGSSIIDVTGQGLPPTSCDAKPWGQVGVKNGQLDTKRGDDFCGELPRTVVNFTQLTSTRNHAPVLLHLGEGEAVRAPMAAAVPAPQERTSRNIFPIIIFTTQDTLPFSQSTPRLTFLRCWIAFICTQCCTGNRNNNNNNTKGTQTPSQHYRSNVINPDITEQ